MTDDPKIKALNSIVFAILPPGINAEPPPEDIRGTGFFINLEGWAVTAAHVLGGYHLSDNVLSIQNGRTIHFQIIYLEEETDFALLHADGTVFPESRLPCKLDFQRGKEHLLYGFHRQNLYEGPQPLLVTSDKLMPIRNVRMANGNMQQELLVLNTPPQNAILPGMSGAPVMDVEDMSLVGLIVGSTFETAAGDPGNEGLARTFDRVSKGIIPFLSLLEGSQRSLFDLFHKFGNPENWNPNNLPHLNMGWLRGQWTRFQSEGNQSRAKVGASLSFFDDFRPIPPKNPRFFMLTRLVTTGEYTTFLEENPGWRKGAIKKEHADSAYLKSQGPLALNPMMPATFISPLAAREYCEWISRKYGVNCRLPDYEEWLEAAQSGRGEDFLQDEILKRRVNFNNIIGSPVEARSGLPNNYGIADTIGNLSEICLGRTPLAVGGNFRSSKSELLESIKLLWNECRDDVGFRLILEEKPNSDV